MSSPKLAGGVLFCPACQTVLKISQAGKITCDYCTASFHIRDVGNVQVKTEGRPRPLQNWLKKVNYKVVQKEDATVNEECPKCGHIGASFTTVQLRSVDEGSTVFYECLKCHHHWSENN